MLLESQFKMLSILIQEKGKVVTQREIAELLGISTGKVKALIKDLGDAGLINEGMQLTPEGFKSMEPYKVKNAVIMAAGMSSRFVPLSYEKPKALLKVKGDILIEREIKQLQEAGITNIIIVVGYLKEKLFYLGEKYNVDIVVNEDYYRFNNTSTLIRVADKLDNTYICSSDNYFTENPFETYVYKSYYSAVFEADETDEYCLTYNKKDRITGITIGGKASWYMMGHVYFDREFSKKFVRILKDEYKNTLTKQQLWENLYMRYIDELDLYIRRYDSEVIKEFDSLEELRSFDEKYLNNANSQIFNNICKLLNISEEEITEITPIKKGLTNSSFCFTVRGKKYVYRHPGVGTSNYINRKSEKSSLEVARKLGLDDTFIYMDENEGWKVSHFIENTKTLDYHNKDQVSEAMRMIRTLHSCGINTGYTFDIWEENHKFEKRLESCGRNQFEDMEELHNKMECLHEYVNQAGDDKCLCHCDAYDPNFLVDSSGKMYLIDWEYSGMANRGSDLGTFIACSDYTMVETDVVLDIYLGHKATESEKRYYLSYVAAASYYWFLWAIYQDSLGKNVGEYLYIWYKNTKVYSKRALSLFERSKVYGKQDDFGKNDSI